MSHIHWAGMSYDVGASKKSVSVTLNEGLVRVAQAYTDNLSGTIAMLPAKWAQTERRKQEDDLKHRREVAAEWNTFDERHGRFADEWNRDFMPDDENR